MKFCFAAKLKNRSKMIHYITPKQLYVPPFHFPWEDVLTKVLTQGYFGNYGPECKMMII